MMPRTTRYPTRTNRNFVASGSTSGTQAISGQDLRRQVNNRLVTNGSHAQLGSQAPTHDLVVSRSHNYQSNSHHAGPSLPQGSHSSMYSRYQPPSTMPTASMAHQSNYAPVLNNASNLNHSTGNMSYQSSNVANNYRTNPNMYQCMPVLTQSTPSDNLSTGHIHPGNKKYQNLQLVKLNSFEVIQILISPRSTYGELSWACFNTKNAFECLAKGSEYKVLLRFCKYSPSIREHQDCLPKSFNVSINNHVYTVKNKYTYAPYDITSRISVESVERMTVKISLEQGEQSEDYCYGLYLVRKLDHHKIVADFIKKPPYDLNFSINLVKRKLRADDEVGLVDNVIRVSLLCPITQTKIRYPARSKLCEHIHCFDAQAFIMLNSQNPKWRCPHCKIFIKYDDMITDGLFNRIMKEALEDSVEAKVFPDGDFEFVKIEDKKKDKGNSITQLSQVKRDSMPTKRTLIETSTSDEQNQKKKKSNKEVECITVIDSDDEDSTNTSHIPSTNRPSSHNNLVNPRSNSGEDNSRSSLSDNCAAVAQPSSGIASSSQQSSVGTSVRSASSTVNVSTSEGTSAQRAVQVSEDDDGVEIVYEKINQPIRVYVASSKKERQTQNSSSHYVPSDGRTNGNCSGPSNGASLVQRHLQQYPSSRTVPHPYAAPTGLHSSSHNHQSNGFNTSQNNHWRQNTSRQMNNMNHSTSNSHLDYSMYNDPMPMGDPFNGTDGFDSTPIMNYAHYNSTYSNSNSRYSNYNAYNYGSTPGMASSMSNGSMVPNASNSINGYDEYNRYN